MTHRSFNILSIILILLWIWADRYLQFGAPAYGILLFIYVAVLFSGSYFIRMNFFLKSISSANTKEKIIALSFDDGPAGNKTSRLLDLLKLHQVEATFFCLGKNMETDPAITKRIIAEGHLIGNHSYSHKPFFSLFSSRKMEEELTLTNRICQQITGFVPRFFRPPYGVTNPNVKKAVLKKGMTSIGWSIRSYDTIIRNKKRLLNRILSRLKPGAILLLHDHPEITVEILPELLEAIRKQGYQFRRLDKMINLNPYE